MKRFEASWFQRPDGSYLSYEEHSKSKKTYMAPTLEDAIEIAKEFENVDSEIPFEDRVLVLEIT